MLWAATQAGHKRNRSPPYCLQPPGIGIQKHTTSQHGSPIQLFHLTAIDWPPPPPPNTSMKLPNPVLKPSIGIGDHHSLWQWIPQTNYVLSKELPPFVCPDSNKNIKDKPTCLNYSLQTFIGLCFIDVIRQILYCTAANVVNRFKGFICVDYLPFNQLINYIKINLITIVLSVPMHFWDAKGRVKINYNVTDRLGR